MNSAMWILALIGLIVLCVIIKLLFKRSVLLKKIKKNAARNGYTVQSLRNCFLSVFIHDCNPDFTITRDDGESLEVSVLTTPFRKVRYHFESAHSLEIVLARKGVLLGNPRAYGNHAMIDHVHIIRKYKINLLDQAPPLPNTKRLLIVHPVPRELSAVQGTQLAVLGNGDLLWNGFTICSLSYFCETYLK